MHSLIIQMVVTLEDLTVIALIVHNLNQYMSIDTRSSLGLIFQRKLVFKFISCSTLTCVIVEIISNLMFIGASHHCKQFCEEEDKRKFDKFHQQNRHTVYDTKIFKEENKQFMRKSKRAWNGFAIKLETFFKKLKNQIQFIQNEAFNRLEIEEIKTAINSDQKHLVKITTDIVQQRYRNLTCQDIDEFVQIRKQQQNVSYLKTERQEGQFAHELISQIQLFFEEIRGDLASTKTNTRGRGSQQTKKPRRERQYQRQVPQRKEEREQRRQRQPTRQYHRQERGAEDKVDLDFKKKNYKDSVNRDQDRRIFRKRQDDQPQSNKYNKQANVKKTYEKDVANEVSNKPCPLLKIANLNQSHNAFSIQVKLMRYIKTLHDKQVWRVSDDTGQIKLVIPNHPALKDSAKITLNNCYIKAFGQDLQIHTKFVSTISSQDHKEQALNTTKNRQQRTRRNDDNEQFKTKRLSKIQQITPESQNLKFVAKVLKIAANEGLVRCVLGDETGTVQAKFKGFEQFLKEGNIVYFRGVEAQVQKCHIILSGNKIMMEMAHDSIKYIKHSNNVSSREYQEINE